MIRAFTTALLVAVIAVHAVAQSPSDRALARTHNKLAWDYMRGEQFENAAKSFQQAVELDPAFDMPWYGLGRAHLALRQYVSAISALSRCRDIYVQRVGRQFTNQQEAQRFRNDRIAEIDEMIRQVQTGPMTAQRQDQLRQLQEHRRLVQEAITRGNSVMIENAVPAWVSLSLGSAYFRSGKFPEAEREYKAAIESDPRAGEALNNLAVVYFETQRYALADKTLQAAKKTGFRVNPEFEKSVHAKSK